MTITALVRIESDDTASVLYSFNPGRSGLRSRFDSRGMRLSESLALRHYDNYDVTTPFGVAVVVDIEDLRPEHLAVAAYSFEESYDKY
jgi:hypothetical protein